MVRDRRAIGAAALVALVGASCAKKEAPAPEIGTKPSQVIGVSLLTLANPFFKVMGDAMQAEAEARGYEVTITSADMDPARQKDQVKDFISKKVAAIVLCPADSRSIATSIQEANQAGIPVFTADIACLDKSARVVSHIATDNFAGGKLAAEAMMEALNGKGKVAIIDHPEVESVILRTNGFREVISKSPGIQVVAQLPGGGMRDTSFKTAQDILEKHADLDGIFAINDPSALGAIAAIEKAGRMARIKVVGFDGQPEAKQAIKDGKMHADSIQYPDKIGKLTIEAVAKYFAGEQVPSETLIPTGLYKKADADADPGLK
jgi:ribose transport system substrate-binding protein